jgi:phytoene dehydrogenase-like protein
MGHSRDGRIVVIGARINNLTAALPLLKAGLDVTVLETHIYSGGRTGTFYHQGYRFDAGATLAGGGTPGGTGSNYLGCVITAVSLAAPVAA